ncbi:DUF2188 domain-containing protein [Micromonospora sp. WMMD980]|uniref:DUF2188 domain-containing protein n=1 Tax=Micromonospora sp. WMMD980 TaxID=3016088 RepID=UPI002416D1B7|nr:DUF2188 domain-containing protein [Micromonospora sp. WMMD980]MDG4802195.1 DUF2188 domain-containing protein [Micromonospora sp. WMMD980]
MPGKAKPVHVVPRDGDWAVVREGNRRASSVHSTQAGAEKVGRPAARAGETEFYLHGEGVRPDFLPRSTSWPSDQQALHCLQT